jgi:hypothetical protein
MTENADAPTPALVIAALALMLTPALPTAPADEPTGKPRESRAKLEEETAWTRAAVRAQESRIQNWRKTVEEFERDGGFIVPYTIQVGENKKTRSTRYVVVSEQAMTDLITEMILLDPKIKLGTSDELTQLIKDHIGALRKRTRDLRRQLAASLPDAEAFLKRCKAVLASTEKRLAALPPTGSLATRPADAPPAADPAAGLKAVRKSIGTTVTYFEAGKEGRRSFTITFTFDEDGQLWIHFGGARPRKVPAGGTSFSFETKSGRRSGTSFLNVQITAGVQADGRLVCHGQYTFRRPASLVPERRKPVTRFFWNGVGPKPAGWIDDDENDQ